MQGRHSEEFEVEMVRGDSFPHPLDELFDADLLSSDLQSSAEFLEADWMASMLVHS